VGEREARGKRSVRRPGRSAGGLAGIVRALGSRFEGRGKNEEVVETLEPLHSNLEPRTSRNPAGEAAGDPAGEAAGRS
jgi:hypothetical protein